MGKYTGEKNMDKALEYMSSTAKLKMEPMPQKSIDVVLAAYPDKIFPRQYIVFLKKAGKYFSPWIGSDYVLVDKNGSFIDFSEEVKEDEDLDEKFREYGFSYDECFFFYNHQGNAYAFFRFDEGDDPPVYVFDPNCEGMYDPIPSFTEYVIGVYNSHVAWQKAMNAPWSVVHVRLGASTLNYLQSVFSYTPDGDTINIPYDFDVYKINAERSADFLERLNPILKSCIIRIRSLWVCIDKVMYLYTPADDTEYENPYGLDIYNDKTFILEREYKWGWFTIKDKVYVFGNKFRELIAENLDKFDIVKYKKQSGLNSVALSGKNYFGE